MTSCRGILIAGVTNEARTQMAEGFLRALTSQRLFVRSGGVHHRASVLSHAIASMQSVGVDISQQLVSSLESAMRQRDTYDVYVSIDASYRNRRADRYQRLRRVAQEQDACSAWECLRDDSDAHSGCTVDNVCASSLHPSRDADAANKSHSRRMCDQGAEAKFVRCEMNRSTSMPKDEGNYSLSNLLTPATPNHWTVATDAADARQRWVLWSPRDPSIYYENSTRKFQDHLYEGEPLFAQMRHSRLRLAAAVLSQRWEVAEVGTAYAMESAAQQRARVDCARNGIARRCVQLLRELETRYAEPLITNVDLAERLCAANGVAEGV